MPPQALRLRLKSVLTNRVGSALPEFPIIAKFSAAPGAVGTWLITAPKGLRVTRIDYVHEVNGAGSSVISVRKHVAGQTAAANAATSGSNIVDLVTGGIPADSTLRTPAQATVVAANAALGPGAKLALVTPATWVGTVTVWVMFQ